MGGEGEGGLIGFSISRLLEVDGEGKTDFLQICNFDFNSDRIQDLSRIQNRQM